MISLRTRLAVLSAVLSGAIIVLLALFVESYVRETLLKSVDLKLVPEVTQALSDVHPIGDAVELESRMRLSFGELINEGSRFLMIRDDFSEEVLLVLPDDRDWVSALDQEFWQGSAEEQDRLANLPPRPRGKGRGVDSFLAEILGDDEGSSVKGRKGVRSQFDPKFATKTFGERDYRFVVSRNHGFSAVIGVPLDETRAELGRLRRSYLLGVPIAIFCIALGGWIVANHALKPVREITRTAEQITAIGLDERIPSGKHIDAEFSQLIRVLNGMIGRLEQSFNHANRFSSDVSHELKTPIAIMQGKLDEALKDCEPGAQVESHLITVQSEVHRLKSIINGLMTLAQADAGELSNRTREEISLTREMNAICEDAEILCEDAGLSFTAEIQPGMAISTNRVLFHQAVQNLISNAIKYNRENGAVAVAASSGLKGVKIRVSNTGPGIPAAEQKEIFSRFHRGDKSRGREIDGFGIGLNLALEIFRSLGGDLKLVSSDEALTEFEATIRSQEKGARTTLLLNDDVS